MIEYPVTSSKRAGSLLNDPFVPREGVLRVAAGAGLGITLDEDEVQRRVVRD